MKTTCLEAWIANKIGLGQGLLSREHLEQYQQKKLQETVRWACQRSPFYRSFLQGFTDKNYTSLADLRQFPLISADQLRQNGLQFLCVSQDDISRVVTLDSSGTTGPAKRIYFTKQDQELTLQIFQYGMANLAEPGDRVLILLPGERPGSVGDLLAIALNRLGAIPVHHGVVTNIPFTLELITRKKVNVLVGIPTQVLALARYSHTIARQHLRFKSVLLSTDHVPQVVTKELERLWQCEVFEHYGMTEMGLGGGTACAAHDGYHLHEADYYYELVNPLTGEPIPDGHEGELVVTTLTRKGMPLIRYRTGDISRIINQPCPCGSSLRRLDRIRLRNNSQIKLDEGNSFTLAELDEVLLAVTGVINFQATIERSQTATTLRVTVTTVGEPDKRTEQSCLEALNKLEAICATRISGRLTVVIAVESCNGYLLPTSSKRTIAVKNMSSQ